jgi:hypothetical protein
MLQDVLRPPVGDFHHFFPTKIRECKRNIIVKKKGFLNYENKNRI